MPKEPTRGPDNPPPDRPTPPPPIAPPAPEESLLAGESILVTVSAKSGWQSSNLEFAAGNLLVIDYRAGSWTGNSMLDELHGPEGPGADAYPGGSTYPMPGTVENCLIGRIGSGEPFYIGRGIAKRLTENGVLQMRINDEDSGPGLADNFGAISMRVLLPIP